MPRADRAGFGDTDRAEGVLPAQAVSLGSLTSIPLSLLPLAQVQTLLEEMLEKLPDEFNMAELLARVEERTPYAVVALQECERMNALTAEMRRSLGELELGLKVLMA